MEVIYIIEKLDKLAKLAQQKDKENREFINYLKKCDHYKVDKIVHQLSQKYLKQYDCTNCGNCCKKLTPSLTHTDITKIASYLKITYEKFIKNYVEKEIPGGFILKGRDCPFIENNKCSIYEYRPEICRSFPHLNKDNINNRLLTIIDNSSICPIIYEVIEDLKNIF